MNLSTFLRRAGGVGVIGIADRLAGLCLAVILARWLGAQGYGQYAFVMALVLLLLIPAEFGVPDWLMRRVAQTECHQSGSIALVKCVTITGALGAGVAIFASGAAFVLVRDQDLFLALIVGFCLLPLRGALNTFGFYLRGLARAQAAQIGHVLLPTILGLAAILLAMSALQPMRSAQTALLFRLFAVAVSIGLVAWALRNQLGQLRDQIHNTSLRIRDILQGAAPFMLIGAMTRLLTRTDVIMLGLLASTTEAGIYFVALQGALVVQFAMTVSNAITTPEFARMHAALRIDELRKYAAMTARSVLVVGIPIAGCLVLFGGALLGALFGPDFAMGATPLAILALGHVVSSAFGAPGFLLNMTGREYTSFRIYSGLAILNIALNALLIPIAGATGAAIATACVLVLQNILLWIAVRNHLGFSCAVI